MALQALRRRKTRESILTYAGLAFFLVLALFPIYWMVITAFKQDSDLIDSSTVPFWFGRSPTFGHFQYLILHTSFITWMFNTLIISVFTVVITLALSVPAAYALARLRFHNAENF